MATPAEPPRFSEADIYLEKRRIALIDQLLAEKGALKIDKLYKHVQKSDSNLFTTLDMLKNFIQSRSNIFEADEALTTEIRNRSLEYREAMLYIVEKLAKSTKQQKINFISAELGSHFPTVKKFEVGSGDAASYKFVSDHKSILDFKGPVVPKADQRLVGMHPLAWTIPSVWIKETLPVYNTSSVRFDRSITINGTGRVVDGDQDTNYLKLEIIDHQLYSGQYIHVRGIFIGYANVDLTERFPRKSLVQFTAFCAYFAAHPWTASSIKDSPENEGVNVNERHQTVVSQQSFSSVNYNNQSSIVVTTWSSSAAEAQVESTTEKAYEKDEQKLIELIDSIVGGQRMLVHSLWTHLQKKQAICLLLKDEAALVQFLKDRPHLYFVDQDFVMLRSNLHRSVVSQVINDLKGGTKYTVNSLGARVGFRAPEFKRDVYGSGNQWIHKFIQDHQTLLEIVGPYDPNNPLAQSVQLRQAPVTKEKPIQSSSASVSPPAATTSASNSDPMPLIHGCGVIKKLNKAFGYLMIEDGELAGDTVYFTAALLQNDCGTTDNIGVGTYLNFDATRPGIDGKAHPWCATRLSLAIGKAVSPLSAPSEERSISSSEAFRELHSPASTELSEAAVETTSKKEPSPPMTSNDIIDREMNRKAMIDNYLEFVALSVDKLFEKFATSQNKLFSYQYQMVEYLCIRSHLYAVDFANRSVSRRSTDYRRAVTLLLSRCSSSDNLLVEDLRQFAHLSSDGTFTPIANQCASKLKFEDLLKEHEQLFEMTEVIDDNENRFVHIRGTYDADRHVFLPRYYL